MGFNEAQFEPELETKVEERSIPQYNIFQFERVKLNKNKHKNIVNSIETRPDFPAPQVPN